MVLHCCLLFLRLCHSRQIVNIDMAGEAFREHFVERCLVRLAVTVGALRYITVLVLMAGDTGQSPVLTGGIRQLAEYLGMAGTTGARGNILAEADLPWLVNRVARKAG